MHESLTLNYVFLYFFNIFFLTTYKTGEWNTNRNENSSAFYLHLDCLYHCLLNASLKISWEGGPWTSDDMLYVCRSVLTQTCLLLDNARLLWYVSDMVQLQSCTFLGNSGNLSQTYDRPHTQLCPIDPGRDTCQCDHWTIVFIANVSRWTIVCRHVMLSEVT